MSEQQTALISQEPVIPYFTYTYNTLISVVQGLALCSLLYQLGQHFSNFFGKNSIISFFDQLYYIFCTWDSWVFLLKFILTFLMINIFWHRYVSHSPFSAWRLRIFDSSIIMLFAFVQYILILTLNSSILHFSFVTLVFYGLGTGAYCYGHKSNKSAYRKLAYSERFQEFSDYKLSEKMSETVNKFEEIAILQFLRYSILQLTLFACILVFQKATACENENIITLTYFTISIMMLIPLLKNDLNTYFKKSEGLQDFRAKEDKEKDMSQSNE